MHIHDILDVYKHMQCSDVTGGADVYVSGIVRIYN